MEAAAIAATVSRQQCPPATHFMRFRARETVRRRCPRFGKVLSEKREIAESSNVPGGQINGPD